MKEKECSEDRENWSRLNRRSTRREIFMKVSMILVIIIGIVAAFTTMKLTGKSDQDYSTATKGNLTNLTLIYVGLGVISVIGIAYLLIKFA